MGKSEARRRTVTAHLDDLLEVTFVDFYGAKYLRIYEAIKRDRWWLPPWCRLLTITHKKNMGRTLACADCSRDHNKAGLWIDSDWFGKRYTDHSRRVVLLHEIGHLHTMTAFEFAASCITDPDKRKTFEFHEEDAMESMAYAIADRVYREGKK